MSLIIPNTFANATTDLALSDLDENFQYLATSIDGNSDSLNLVTLDTNNLKTGITVGDNVTLTKNLILPNTTTLPTGSTITSPDVGAVYVPGSIIQVKYLVKTDTFSAAPGTNNFSDITGLSLTITPKSVNSKILVSWSIHTGFTAYQVKGRLKRNGNPIGIGDANGVRPRLTFYGNTYTTSPATANQYHVIVQAGQYLDSPSSVSELTYNFDIGSYATNTVYVNRSHLWQNTTDYDGTPISSITLMEVAG